MEVKRSRYWCKRQDIGLFGVLCFNVCIDAIPPWGRRGFKPRIRPPCPQRVVKGD